jgi:peptidoglycan/LPS O-acetylase OafA/YrhL
MGAFTQLAPTDRQLPDHAKRADIQGLRAVAVLLVVAYHGQLPVPGGFIGVDVFFVVSGFVITAMLTRKLNTDGRFSFAVFYTRRMRRLLPALAVMTTVTVALSTVLLSPLGPQQATAGTVFAASVFLANVQLGLIGGGGYFDLTAETNAMLHTWSLSVEEQFYFLFPAFLYLGWLSAKRRGAVWCIVAATILSFAYSWYATYHHAFVVSAFYSPAARVWEFGVGSLIALAAVRLQRLNVLLAHAFGAVGVILIGVGAFTISKQTAWPGLSSLLPVIGTGLVIIAGTVSDRGIAAALSVRPATLIGDLSYSWYLWHWPLIVFAAALWPGNTWIPAIVAAATLIPAWLSFRFVENPIRSNSRIVGRRAVRLVVVCMTGPALASIALLGVNWLERQTATVQSIADAVQLHGSETRPECRTFDVGSCVWPVSEPRGTIYLVGDSNAAQFTEPLAEAANDEGYRLVVTAQPSCPFADLVVAGPHVENGPRCHQYVTGLVDKIAAERPSLVILANSSSAYIENYGLKLTNPETGSAAVTPEAKARLWSAALESVLKPLGAPTVLIHPIPHFGQWPWDWQPEACPFVRMVTDSCPAGRISRDDVELQQRRARDAEILASAGLSGVTSVDLTEAVCAASDCSTDRGMPWLYRDATHLSIDGALTLTERFRQVIIDNARG